MNRWLLTDEIREKIKPLLSEYLNKVENLTVEQVEQMSNEELGLDLSDKGINPYQLQSLLEEFGYKEYGFDSNGWQYDFCPICGEYLFDDKAEEDGFSVTWNERDIMELYSEK